MDFSQKLQTFPNGETVALSDDLHHLLQFIAKQTAPGSDLYQYQGFCQKHFQKQVEAIVFPQKHFQAQDTDIILASAPKSGTTWLKSLVFAITKRAEHAPGDPNHPLLRANPQVLVPSFENTYDCHNSNPDLSHVPPPRLIGTHGPYNLLPESVKTGKCRVICLSRNPKDVFISFWHFLDKLVKPAGGDTDTGKPVPFEDFFELFRRGVVPFGPIWDHSLGYWNTSLEAPDKVLFLKYEDLKGDINAQVRKIAEFTGFPFSAEEESEGVVEKITKMCSFECLSSLEVNKTGVTADVENKSLFRKGEVGDWKNYMTPSMAEELDKVTEEKLLGSGLRFM